jgi:hypothetical protein
MPETRLGAFRGSELELKEYSLPLMIILTVWAEFLKAAEYRKSKATV